MKKIITLALFVLIETSCIVMLMLLYQSNKQIFIANELFDNTIESLRARNFSQQAIQQVHSDTTYPFQIQKIDAQSYEVSMQYTLILQPTIKTLRSIVYVQQ